MPTVPMWRPKMPTHAPATHAYSCPSYTGLPISLPHVLASVNVCPCLCHKMFIILPQRCAQVAPSSEDELAPSLSLFL